MKKVKLLLLLISISWSSFSQDLIEGVVKDASGMPIPGVNILEKGTKNGAVTDFDGGYQITVSPDAVLVFSSIGFETQEINTTGKSNINLTMVEDVEGLDEIVIVGYGQQKKESVLGAINQVKGSEILETGSASLTNALSGIAPGLNIVQTTGAPGADDGQLFIRGNADPLILVDGVEIVGGFANIDTRDVETISVLKDGAATAIYGIRGANGVIIITTKRGKIGKPKVSITSEFSVKTLDNIPERMDAFTAQSLRNVALLNGQDFSNGYSTEKDLGHWRDGDLPYLYPDIDWFELMVKDYNTSSNHTVSVRGGNDFVKYYASAGYLQEGNIINTVQFYNYDPGFKFSRYSYRGNLDFTFTKSTTLKTSVSSRLEDRSSPGSAGLLGLLVTGPGVLYPMYPEEALEQYPDPLYPGLVEPRFGTGFNTFRNINTQGLNQTISTVFSLDLELNQKLDFVTEGLSFTAKYNYVNNYVTQRSVIFDQTVVSGIDTYTLERDGTWTSVEGENYERPLDYNFSNESISGTEDISLFRTQFNYNRSFNKHNVSGLAIFSRNKRVGRRRNNNYFIEFPYFEEDWISRFTYNYDNRYFLELTGTYNGDETFAEGYRFKFFPSYSIGVNLAKEKFVKDNIPAINNFKIRYSYGETGEKSGLNGARWQYLNEFNFTNDQRDSRFYFGENINERLNVISQTRLGNEILTWAEVAKSNIGVDFGLFKNKISGSVDFFKEERTGLIERPSGSLPSFVGSVIQPSFANFGARESKGYEAEITYKNTTPGGFTYSIGALYAFYDNRVVLSSLDGPGTPEYTTVAGKPTGAVALLQTDGFFQSIDEVVNYPVATGTPGLGDYRYIDYNANGTVIGTDTQDQIRFNLPTAPQNSYSLRLSASYKKWSMSALINGIEGHRGVIAEGLAYAIASGPSGLQDRIDYWSHDNRDAKYPALHITNNPNLSSGHSSRIIDLDYIKLRSVNLSYSFDVSKSETFSNLRLYLNGNNLITITDVDFGNPEGNSPGAYPITRRINLGLNMSF